MGFFEFNNYGYYALIMAETEEDAIELYEKEIAYISEEDGPPDEITEDEAILKMAMVCDSSGVSKSETLEELNQHIKENKACVVLTDGALS